MISKGAKLCFTVLSEILYTQAMNFQIFWILDSEKNLRIRKSKKISELRKSRKISEFGNRDFLDFRILRFSRFPNSEIFSISCPTGSLLVPYYPSDNLLVSSTGSLLAPFQIDV